MDIRSSTTPVVQCGENVSPTRIANSGNILCDMPFAILEHIVGMLPLADICIHSPATAVSTLARVFAERRAKLEDNLSLEDKQQLILSVGPPTYQWSHPQITAYLRVLAPHALYTRVVAATHCKLDMLVALRAIWAGRHVRSALTAAAVDAVSELDDPLLRSVLGPSFIAAPPANAGSLRDLLLWSSIERVIALDEGILLFNGIGLRKSEVFWSREGTDLFRKQALVRACVQKVHEVWGRKRQAGRAALTASLGARSRAVTTAQLTAADKEIADARALLQTFDHSVIVID